MRRCWADGAVLNTNPTADLGVLPVVTSGAPVHGRRSIKQRNKVAQSYSECS